MTNFPTVNEDTPEQVLRVRHAMAFAYVSMLTRAYEALLNYGINYRTLPTFKDPTLIDEANRLPLHRGQSKYVEWCKRVESDIQAAINRKGMRRV